MNACSLELNVEYCLWTYTHVICTAGKWSHISGKVSTKPWKGWAGSVRERKNWEEKEKVRQVRKNMTKKIIRRYIEWKYQEKTWKERKNEWIEKIWKERVNQEIWKEWMNWRIYKEGEKESREETWKVRKKQLRDVEERKEERKNQEIKKEILDIDYQE